MAAYETLSASAQTTYAQLLEAAQGAELTRSIGSLGGTFARKQVKGRVYWYFQFMATPGQKRQFYVGPDNEQVRTLVEAHRRGGATRALERLAQAAIALGHASMLPRHFRIVQRLADYGFFRAGGVLVGTHAFLAMGGMLGVRWTDALRTQDVDFAHAGRTMTIALPTDIQIDMREAIESLQMGLLPIQHMDGTTGASWLDPRDPEFRIDFLTPRGRGGGAPFRHPQLGVLLQPLKFMEYLLEDVQHAALVANAGVVLTNVPHPARYALHKLIVAGERAPASRAKADKDLQQSAALLRALDEAGLSIQVTDAWHDLLARGPGWASRAHEGLRRLLERSPDPVIERMLGCAK
ncbi:GSU2403 family nucleotidyltransferase fold protein [Luteimonas sp. A478]